jgi:hypothetical protein
MLPEIRQSTAGVLRPAQYTTPLNAHTYQTIRDWRAACSCTWRVGKKETDTRQQAISKESDMKIINKLAVVISIALTLGASAYAQPNQMKVGKKGHVTISQEAKVGDTVLAPGYYEIRHRHSATNHYMEFTLVTENNQKMEGQSVYDWQVVAKVPCTPESLSTPVARTTAQISGDPVALLSLEIRGENVEHVF